MQGLYQIIRQPRLMVGEPTLPLPRDVIIDLDPASDGSSAWINPTTGYAVPGYKSGLPYDILFSERGQVIIGSAQGGQDGKIILRVRNSDRPPNQNMNLPGVDVVYDWGDQFLVTIYTRTGLIATHPLCLDLNSAPNPPLMPFLADPYKFTRDQQTSGF
jgi:hypothetical protein